MHPVCRQRIGKHAYNNRLLLEIVFSIRSVQSGYKENRAIQFVEGCQLRRDLYGRLGRKELVAKVRL
jgi:hypothetical protein